VKNKQKLPIVFFGAFLCQRILVSLQQEYQKNKALKQGKKMTSKVVGWSSFVTFFESNPVIILHPRMM
jgi:hypothetical protein